MFSISFFINFVLKARSPRKMISPILEEKSKADGKSEVDGMGHIDRLLGDSLNFP